MEKILNTVQVGIDVPMPLAVSFKDAHAAENGRARMWVRAMMGDARPPDLKATISGSVATVTGTWNVELPMYGSISMGLFATLVKAQDRWLMVTMGAGEARK